MATVVRGPRVWTSASPTWTHSSILMRSRLTAGCQSTGYIRVPEPCPQLPELSRAMSVLQLMAHRPRVAMEADVSA